MKLHNKEQDFRDAIYGAAKYFKIRELFVEKDYWVTFVLKNLNKSIYADKVVFKGGTSISKAYGIAKRFSEDIDLALTDKDIQSMKNLELAIMLLPLQENAEKKSVLKKNYRQTHWKYPRKIEGNPDPAKENIQLELINNAKTTPNEKRKVRSLIAEYLIAVKKMNLIEEFELQDVDVLVLSHKRTFAEKVIALANASIKNEETLKQKIRHIFDLTVLLMEPEIQQFVQSDEFKIMTDEARKADEDLEFMRDVVGVPWREAPIFSNSDEVLKRIESTYINELTPFIFKASTMPKILQVKKMLRFIIDPSNNKPPKATSKSKKSSKNKK